MNRTKYVAMDVHTASISVAVLNSAGKVIMESVIEAKRSTIVQFIEGLRGELLLTFEEGTWSAWLYDLLTPYVTNIVVCDPRRNALLKEGSANDRIDARKLAELLRLNCLRSVYHGENGLRTLKELVRAYLTISKDLARVMNRIKAIYRSWGIPCAGKSVYNRLHREEWLRKITQASVRRRAEFYYEQLDALVPLRKQARQELLSETKKHQLEIASFDSVPRPDPRGCAHGHCPDAASIPHQANALGVQRVWSRDPEQCRSAVSERAAPAIEEAGIRTWTRPRSQSSSQICIQECRDPGLYDERSVPGFLQRSGRQRHETGNGAPHLGTEDCHDQLDGMAEGSSV